MAACTVSSAVGCTGAGVAERRDDEQNVCHVNAGYGGAADLSVSDIVPFYDEAEQNGKACVCDDDSVRRIYDPDSGRDGGAFVGMVFLSAHADNSVPARSMVLRLYVYDRKSTSEIYAGTQRR